MRIYTFAPLIHFKIIKLWLNSLLKLFSFFLFIMFFLAVFFRIINNASILFILYHDFNRKNIKNNTLFLLHSYHWIKVHNIQHFYVIYFTAWFSLKKHKMKPKNKITLFYSLKSKTKKYSILYVLGWFAWEKKKENDSEFFISSWWYC